MQHVNGIEQATLPAAIAEVRPIRQLIKAADVARKLGVSISWVVQHASGKRKPYLPAVKMGPGRSPLRFDLLAERPFEAPRLSNLLSGVQLLLPCRSKRSRLSANCRPQASGVEKFIGDCRRIAGQRAGFASR